MMIRRFPACFTRRRLSARPLLGISLVEMTFMLLIIGVMLGVIWLTAGTVYQSYDVTKAQQELTTMLQALRQMHPNDKVGKEENLDMLGIGNDMIGHFKGMPILFNPWRGNVTTMPGNAIAWGNDQTNDEFTIRFDGVPQQSCAPFVMKASSATMLSFGLVAVLIAPAQGTGKEFCFAQDSYCLNTVPSLIKSQVEAVCSGKDYMTVMFTYTSH